MRGSEKVFEDIFLKELDPSLLGLDFLRLSLPKGWIQPSFLYWHSKHNIWFGCSWDWRDFYFDGNLGGLYTFKDVLPRVIVCGYAFKKECKSKYTTEYISNQIINAKNSIIDLANKDFEKYFKSINAAQSEKVHRLNSYIEKEIRTTEELPFIR